MKYLDRIQAIRNEASNKFNSFDGNNYSNAVGAGSINVYDRTFTFEISQSTTTATGACRLFGYAVDPTDTYNTANNTVVTCKESSHTEAKYLSAFNPFRIQGIKMSVKASTQFNNPFSMIYSTPNGKYNKLLWQPSNFTNPQNYNSLQIVDESFQTPIDAWTRIEFNVNAGETITVTMFIVDKVDQAQILNSNSILKSTNVGMPTGLVPSKVLIANNSGNTGNGFYLDRY